MKKATDNTTPQPSSNKKAASLTPHQLVTRHMQHPEEPITDADMENMNLEVNPDGTSYDEISLTAEEKKSADELADAIASDSTDTAYKADM